MVTTIVMPIWETMFGVLNMILGKVTSTLWLLLFTLVMVEMDIGTTVIEEVFFFEISFFL